ncbi:hypothetical protein IE53DRAFT_241044 [Violaceomyces palustris]|uniref:Uncharacterized protein n=1 Tax=Violaceomyces palustris TaxID=1673888 RepID=A0ACD0NPA0_9BASI|nr:hypothetical protein IE53DRAFT_241044 [Violaceomyces palustris]
MEGRHGLVEQSMNDGVLPSTSPSPSLSLPLSPPSLSILLACLLHSSLSDLTLLSALWHPFIILFFSFSSSFLLERIGDFSSLFVIVVLVIEVVAAKVVRPSSFFFSVLSGFEIGSRTTDTSCHTAYVLSQAIGEKKK